MKLGLHGINVGRCADPETLVRVAKRAEDAGYDSFWLAEHAVLPDPQVPPSPLPPHVKLLDPVVSLAFLAAHTTRARLATGIVILPQRNPVVLAKELASLDVLSGGRLELGIGAGYLEPEFAAVGVPFADRGRRTDEYLDAILALWTQEKPHYDGRYVRFAGIDAQPRPVQRPHPPIHVGGRSDAAYRRAVQRAHGWYGFGLDLEGTRVSLAGLARAAREVERPPALGRLEISITPSLGATVDDAAPWAALGVHRLVLLPAGRTADEIESGVARAAERIAR
jgi:probable F420-dependent oxidoreductase